MGHNSVAKQQIVAKLVEHVTIVVGHLETMTTIVVYNCLIEGPWLAYLTISLEKSQIIANLHISTQLNSIKNITLFYSLQLRI